MIRIRRPAIASALLVVVGLLATPSPGGAQADPPPPDTVAPLVTGGVDAGPAAAPYMAAVVADEFEGDPDQQQLCGGTVLTDRWVLTASHCVVHVDGSPIPVASLSVVTGSPDLSSPLLEFRPVLQVVMHPTAAGCGRLDNVSAFACRARHDLALLAIDPAPELATVVLARPHQTDLAAAGRSASVYGWGATDAATSVFPDHLQVGAVTIQTSAHCTEQYPSVFDPDTMRCASGLTGGGAIIDACAGDSGGPLAVVDVQGRVRQVGVASFGAAEACGNRPTVYTSVLANHGWIASVTGIVSFPDLVGSPHADAIISAAEAGITTGRADGSYGPNQPLTRGQIASFLTRALDLAPAPQSFPDVAASHPHADAIGAMVGAGITTGRADGTFGPNAPVTRGQMASFLARALDLAPGPVAFPDVAADHPHHDAIGALVTSGITLGRADGTYGPSLLVTRGQIASFLVRGLGLPVG